MSLYNLRREYALHELDLNELADDPIDQFSLWMDDAKGLMDEKVPWYEPTVMTLATCDAEGFPSARILLLKGYDQNGFVFFTNYGSDKGKQLAENPNAAIVIHWAPMERQVRITGVIEKISEEASVAYFDSRPRGSQLGAAASHQSEVVASREVLDAEVDRLDKLYVETAIPKPMDWGGYCLKASKIEFWQGRPNRMHDRLIYTRDDSGKWQISRLSP